jgi:hypothetical protein
MPYSDGGSRTVFAHVAEHRRPAYQAPPQDGSNSSVESIHVIDLDRENRGFVFNTEVVMYRRLLKYFCEYIYSSY